MTEMTRPQHSDAYFQRPAIETSQQSTEMYSHAVSAACFPAYVPSNFSQHNIMMYPLHSHYNGYEAAQGSISRTLSERFQHYSSEYQIHVQSQLNHPFTNTSQLSDVPNDSSLSKLHLPTIKTSSNFAKNVMMEEADLGYGSLSDNASANDIATVEFRDFDNSSGSDDVFDEVSDIIDDFFGDVVNDRFELEEQVLGSAVDIKDIGYPSEQNAFCQELQTSSARPDSKTIRPWLSQNTCNSIVESARDESTEQFLIRVQERKQTPKEDLKCLICYKVFHNKTNLKVHLGMHSNVRPHQCPYCDKAFTQKSTLRTHIRTHTGEKPYSCTFCARAFSDYSTYRKHQRVHTGEKPYVCPVCSKAFAQSGNMIRHKQTHFKKDNQVISEVSET